SRRLLAKLSKAESVIARPVYKPPKGPTTGLVDTPSCLYTPGPVARPVGNRPQGAGEAYEREDPPRLPRDHGDDDRRLVLQDEVDLGQGRRDPAPRHRPEDPPGLDRRPPEHRSRRPRAALQGPFRHDRLGRWRH